MFGLKKKIRKCSSVQVDYLVNVQEVKPWPTSQAQGPIQPVLLQWENTNQNSGFLLSSAGEGKIMYSQSIRLSVKLRKGESGRSRTRDGFRKNYLDLHLYEPRKDKSGKGLLLGTAVLNLAEYGIIEESMIVKLPVNCKKGLRNVAQPVMFVKIQPVERDSNLPKEASLYKERSVSLSSSMNGDCDEELEIASFSDDDDDDVSLHSSLTTSSSAVGVSADLPSLDEWKESKPVEEIARRDSRLHLLLSGAATAQPMAEAFGSVNGGLSPLSDLGNAKNNYTRNFDLENMTPGFQGEVAVDCVVQERADMAIRSGPNNRKDRQDNGAAQRPVKKYQGEATAIGNLSVGLLEDKKSIEQRQNRLEKQMMETKHSVENTQVSKSSQDSMKRPPSLKGSFRSSGKIMTAKPSRSSVASAKCNVSSKSNYSLEKEKVIDLVEVAFEDDRNSIAIETKERSSSSSHGKHKLMSRIEILEEELCDAAAVEAGLYSVVAEHGSTTSKVFAPARRLSRFYLHACRARSQAGRASAARAVISGIVLVSKACGNDVPRLSFWLSNSIVLRVILSQPRVENTAGDRTTGNSEGKGSDESPRTGGGSNFLVGFNQDWEDLQAFIIVLEKVEAWIFSRIVESMWWQTLTPHMQSSAAKCSGKTKDLKPRKTERWKNGLGDQEQGSFAIDLWKKAFKDACESLCPSRAGGHECGCLHLLPRLVMEQLVGRLDVAMFNAILRESDDEMPTDPVSDPICDSMVLPIAVGKSSFKAGAQLKNAIGRWSTWLTDLFVIDHSDNPDDKNGHADEKSQKYESSFKAFPLLNGLSDVMMLPLEMLGATSTRKEVCPAFGVALIKRVLNNFVPDEFCPDPVPDTVLESLDAEELLEDPDGCITSFPCIAAPIIYSPPPTASLICILGDLGSQPLSQKGSLVLKKSYTSDDELDELDSPLTSVVAVDNSEAISSPKLNWMLKGSRGIARYQLLHEVWKIGE